MPTLTLTFPQKIQTSTQVGDMILYCNPSTTAGFSTAAQSDVVFLNKWTDDVLPLLEENEFVCYGWRYDIDQANLPQWSVMKRSLFDSDLLYDEGDLYPNIHYKDTLGLLSLWAREKNKKFFICKNSGHGGDRSLVREHVLNIPNGEQGWINDTPFVYHYGRGTTRADDLKSSWIKAVSEYLKK